MIGPTHKLLARLMLVGVLGLATAETRAQIVDPTTSPEAIEVLADAEAETQDEDEPAPDEDFDDGHFMVTPFAAPSFAPEFGLGLFGGALFSWRSNPGDLALERSVIPLSVGFSTTGSVQGSAIIQTHWLEGGALRANLDVRGARVPDNYWGVGYDSGRNVPQGTETTHFLRLNWQAVPEIFYKFWSELYLGFRMDFGQTVAKDVNARMAQDPNFTNDGDNIVRGGMGVEVLWDSRDASAGAYEGLVLSAAGTFYRSWLGSTYDYQRYFFDYRQYVTIGRPGSTLAWRTNVCRASGRIPWPEFCFLGGGDGLRGYFWGQYRDRLAVWGVLEYRHMFARSRLFGLQHGFVVFAGAGSVAPDFGELKRWLPNGGAGYRVEIQPRMNARIDIGAGFEGVSFYVTFLEAF